jgi:hypothetical protein
MWRRLELPVELLHALRLGPRLWLAGALLRRLMRAGQLLRGG